jgi:ATP phosphoribosyltransferase regulatory subunit
MIGAAERRLAGALLSAFEAAGAGPVSLPLLLDAEALLDLYGEDIRARAFTTHDPLRGEAMLRPDFTVPVVQAHVAAGAGPARYCYAGEVFRRQEAREDRAREYLQAGFESLGAADRAAADAEVFALFSQALAPWGLRSVTGDLGVLIAAIEGLSLSPPRRAALRRHVSRPRRFRRLMDRFTGRAAPAPARAGLVGRARAEGAEALLPAEAPGLRGVDEIAARLARLVEDAGEPPLPAAQADVVEAILSLRGTLGPAIAALRDMAVDLPALGPAADRLSARADALAAQGLDAGALPFEAVWNRTAMEYYDGFVFGFMAGARPDLPLVATGGRYDALTAALAGPGAAPVPAVGGVVRPGVLAALEGAA